MKLTNTNINTQTIIQITTPGRSDNVTQNQGYSGTHQVTNGAQQVWVAGRNQKNIGDN